MIRDLTEISVQMVKAEKTAQVKVKAEQMAEEKILDILIPPVKKPVGITAENEEDPSFQNEKTREWMKEKLRKGEMDEKMIEFDVQAPQVGMQVMGPMGGMDDMGINIQEIVSNMMPKKKKKRKTSIKESS
jgi:ATP-dependent HslUV protease ATP-binding subunit HslU